MRFRTILARRYRTNGYIVVVRDPKTDYYDVSIQKPSGALEWVGDTRNRQVAVKWAKELAMTRKYDFNIETDLIY